MKIDQNQKNIVVLKTEEKKEHKTAFATANRLPVSHKKMALMARTIISCNKQRNAEHMSQMLVLIKKKPALLLEKVIQSAVYNGKNNHYLDVNRLFIKEILVGKAEGNFKRIMARARGRAYQVTKGYCNITVKLEEK